MKKNQYIYLLVLYLVVAAIVSFYSTYWETETEVYQGITIRYGEKVTTSVKQETKEVIDRIRQNYPDIEFSSLTVSLPSTTDELVRDFSLLQCPDIKGVCLFYNLTFSQNTFKERVEKTYGLFLGKNTEKDTISIIITPVAQKVNYENVLYHELVHFTQTQVVNKQLKMVVPFWVTEGDAEVSAMQNFPAKENWIENITEASESYPTLREIATLTIIENPKTIDELKKSYQMGYIAVGYLDKKYGVAKKKELLQKIAKTSEITDLQNPKDQKLFEQVFRQVYPISVAELSQIAKAILDEKRNSVLSSEIL